MLTKETIEDIVTGELKSLCIRCVHVEKCFYYKTATKTIIQCELFEIDQLNATVPQGLCMTCDHVTHCVLPGRKQGVWRCTEFR
jgi:hypothetical protein